VREVHFTMTSPLTRFTVFPLAMFRVFRPSVQLRPFANAMENYTLKKRGQGIDSPFEDMPAFPDLPLGKLSPEVCRFLDFLFAIFKNI
jgi:hypothetical protein